MAQPLKPSHLWRWVDAWRGTDIKGNVVEDSWDLKLEFDTPGGGKHIIDFMKMPFDPDWRTHATYKGHTSGLVRAAKSLHQELLSLHSSKSGKKLTSEEQIQAILARGLLLSRLHPIEKRSEEYEEGMPHHRSPHPLLKGTPAGRGQPETVFVQPGKKKIEAIRKGWVPDILETREMETPLHPELLTTPREEYYTAEQIEEWEGYAQLDKRVAFDKATLELDQMFDIDPEGGEKEISTPEPDEGDRLSQISPGEEELRRLEVTNEVRAYLLHGRKITKYDFQGDHFNKFSKKDAALNALASKHPDVIQARKAYFALKREDLGYDWYQQSAVNKRYPPKFRTRAWFVGDRLIDVAYELINQSKNKTPWMESIYLNPKVGGKPFFALRKDEARQRDLDHEAWLGGLPPKKKPEEIGVEYYDDGGEDSIVTRINDPDRTAHDFATDGELNLDHISLIEEGKKEIEEKLYKNDITLWQAAAETIANLKHITISKKGGPFKLIGRFGWMSLITGLAKEVGFDPYQIDAVNFPQHKAITNRLGERTTEFKEILEGRRTSILVDKFALGSGGRGLTKQSYEQLIKVGGLLEVFGGKGKEGSSRIVKITGFDRVDLKDIAGLSERTSVSEADLQEMILPTMDKGDPDVKFKDRIPRKLRSEDSRQEWYEIRIDPDPFLSGDVTVIENILKERIANKEESPPEGEKDKVPGIVSPTKSGGTQPDRVEVLKDAKLEHYKSEVTGIDFGKLDAEIIGHGGWADSHLTKARAGGKFKPQTQMQGDPGTSYYYTGKFFKGEEIKPWSPMVQSVKDQIEKLTGYDFNLVLIQRYRDGDVDLGWHSDLAQKFDPKTGEHIKSVFGDPESVVVSVNFGAERTFAFKRSGSKEGREHGIPLGDGDVLVMMEGTNANYQHSLVKAKGGSGGAGPRINLTFRQTSQKLIDTPRRK